MNTFGALKYLEAEQTVVEEIMLNLKDQLNKLKIEELAIRASIRRKMKESQANAGDLNELPEANRAFLHEEFSGRKPSGSSGPPNLCAAPTQSVFETGGTTTTQSGARNEPIEVSINDALRMIRRYREQDLSTQSGEDTLETFGAESTELDDTEFDDTEMDEETELDEPTAGSSNIDMEFVDLRSAQLDEEDEEL